MNYREEIGAKIQSIRIQKELSLRDLAEMTGLDHSNIGKIEKGKYNVGIDILGKIADALFIDLKLEIMEHIKRIEEVLTEIANGEECHIQKEVKLDSDEAAMYHFICNGFEAACIVYNDGTIFHQDDWQSGRPDTAEEIEDFDWISADGRTAIILNGLPRIFC